MAGASTSSMTLDFDRIVDVIGKDAATQVNSRMLLDELQKKLGLIVEITPWASGRRQHFYVAFQSAKSCTKQALHSFRSNVFMISKVSSDPAHRARYEGLARQSLGQPDSVLSREEVLYKDSSLFGVNRTQPEKSERYSPYESRGKGGTRMESQSTPSKSSSRPIPLPQKPLAAMIIAPDADVWQSGEIDYGESDARYAPAPSPLNTNLPLTPISNAASPRVSPLDVTGPLNASNIVHMGTPSSRTNTTGPLFPFVNPPRNPANVSQSAIPPLLPSPSIVPLPASLPPKPTTISGASTPNRAGILALGAPVFIEISILNNKHRFPVEASLTYPSRMARGVVDILRTKNCDKNVWEGVASQLEKAGRGDDAKHVRMSCGSFEYALTSDVGTEAKIPSIVSSSFVSKLQCLREKYASMEAPKDHDQVIKDFAVDPRFDMRAQLLRAQAEANATDRSGPSLPGLSTQLPLVPPSNMEKPVLTPTHVYFADLFTHFQTRLHQVSEELTSVKAELSTSTVLNTQLKGSCDQLRSRASTAQASNTSLTQVNLKLKAENHRTSVELERTQNEMARIKAENDGLRRKWAEEKKKLADEEKRRKVVEDDLARANERKWRLTEDLERLERTIDSVRDAVGMR